MKKSQHAALNPRSITPKLTRHDGNNWTLILLTSQSCKPLESSRHDDAECPPSSSDSDQVVCSERPREGSFSPSGGRIAAVRWRQDPITSLIHLLIFSRFFSEGVRGDRQEQIVQLHRSCGHSPTSCPTRGPHAELGESKPRVVYAVRLGQGGSSWMKSYLGPLPLVPKQMVIELLFGKSPKCDRLKWMESLCRADISAFFPDWQAARV